MQTSYQDKLLRVAVPVPVADSFDYLATAGAARPAIGARVKVPFGRGERIGVVVAHPDTPAITDAKLKPVLSIIDDEPALDAELLESLAWAADYYHHPIGEVLNHALPAMLRRGGPAEPRPEPAYRVTATGRDTDVEALARRGPRQAEILKFLRTVERARDAELQSRRFSPDALRRLLTKRLVERFEILPELAPDEPRRRETEEAPPLTEDQQAAVDAVLAAGDGFHPYLLEGVTGSGKTEVFLQLISRALESQRQTLLLVPEISLTPQLVQRLSVRFGHDLAVLHSSLSDSARLKAWQSARSGHARLIVGTRSAVFIPLPRPGLIIIDEEHDPSFKQQTGFRYSARDLAIVRARALNVPVLLASATPALESVHNAELGRYTRLRLNKRIGAAGQPRLRIIDMNAHAARQGLSTPLLDMLEQHIDAGNQVLLFINRRGFAPALFCPACERTEECNRCDARMTVHARAGRLRCHHCGGERELRWSCPACGSERIAVGSGTQRVTDELRKLYPQYPIARLDRDVLTRRDELASILAKVESGETRIIVGTQLLAKGHDFPGVTLVGVLNADQGLFGADFRAEERLAQTIVQVAGRSGRRDRPGDVLIQTHYPNHPLLESLLDRGYRAFAELALAERKKTGWPPFSHLALFRVEASAKSNVFAFLERLATFANALGLAVRVLGPTPEIMERRSGRFRGLLLLQSTNRPALHALLTACLSELKTWRETRRVRWSIDVDPVEL